MVLRCGRSEEAETVSTYLRLLLFSWRDRRFRHFNCRMLGIDIRQEVLGIENLTWRILTCSREFSFNWTPLLFFKAYLIVARTIMTAQFRMDSPIRVLPRRLWHRKFRRALEHLQSEIGL